MNPHLKFRLQRYEVIVFDLDGTLVEGIPYEQLLEEVAEITGVSLDHLLKQYRSNFTGVYDARDQHLCLAANDAKREQVAEAYERFILAKSRPAVLQGSRELLGELREIEPPKMLICWTRGDEKLQRNVLHVSELERFFDTVICVNKKNPEAVQKNLLPVINGRKFVAIGDMYDQDIQPLLKHACGLIWISGSRANRYVKRPGSIPKKVVETSSIAALMR